MAQCEVCGNEYDKAFQVTMAGGDSHTFDSFECAIHALAPTCEYCNVKVIGHGVEADGRFFRCAHCASMAEAEGVADRASASELFSRAPGGAPLRRAGRSRPAGWK